ncbi:MAG: peptidoglycan-binding protein [Treponema sp.]|nr:peptidoglycan-binding protein [Treponema sp.]
MNCREIMDMVYEYDGDDSAPLCARIRIRLHALFCLRCGQELERYTAAREALRDGFFTPAGLEESVMARILREDPVEADEYEEEYAGEGMSEEAGVSFRSWIITGILMFFSLSTSFFSLNFTKLAISQDLSFLLPMGITIGAVLTIYCTIFIGSHIKELSEKFGLR